MAQQGGFDGQALWALDPADGKPGGCGATGIKKADSSEWKTVQELFGRFSSSKYANVQFLPGDRIRLTTPGGGGYGEPKDRDPQRVWEDVLEGYVSPEAAVRDYGWHG